MQSVLVPAQGSYFLLRIMNGSFQTLESLKDQISLYFSRFLRFSSSLDLIESRSISSDRTEKKEISNGEGEEPRGAVFNALDAMLKGSLDRLTTMRESLSWGHTSNSSVIYETVHRTDNSMIRALCLEGKLGTALWLWKTVVQQLRIPDVVTHNYLLNVLCKSGDLGRAEWLVTEMLKNGPHPSCATYNTLMNGYCIVNELDKALDVFSTMAHHGIGPNRVSCNILVHSLCQKGLLEDARKLFAKILADDKDGEKSDLITSTIHMDGYIKSGNMVEALTCWNDVFERGIEVDVVAYNVIIHGYCLTGDLTLVYKSLCNMFKSGHVPDVFTYNTLIGELCKSGRIDEACCIFAVMSRMGVPPDHITYKMVIQGDISFALQLRNEMVRRGCEPDIITYTELLKCYCLRSKMEEAEELFFWILMTNLPIDHVPFVILMKKCFKMGELDKVYDLYRIWLRKGRTL